VSHAWAGFSLAGLFFYPLASALNGGAYYLQWQPRHAAETLAALALLAAALGAPWAAARRLTGVAGALAHVALAAVPLASLAVAVVAQFRLRGALIPLWDLALARYGVPLAAAAALVTAVVARPALVARALRASVAILSPVALLVLLTVTRSAWNVPPVVARASAAATGPGTGAPSARCRPVLAFLFDELSFSYLYDGSRVRGDLPALRRFSDRATNHLAVSAPGRETLVSLPGFLAARRVEHVAIEDDRVWEVSDSGVSVPFDAQAPEGLFGTARRLGFRTEMAGYYFAYCDLLGPHVDACASYSFYNAASVRTASPLNPVRTTFVLWPRQFPFGLAKGPAFARQQRDLVAGTLPFAAAPLDPARPVFRFVHFSVPHLPFAFDARGFAPAADPLRTVPDDAFVRQVAYVDRLFGELIDRLDADTRARDATVVLFADHGFRFGGRERDPLQIPFLVRHSGQQWREDVTTPERGEMLLRETLVDACR
jgi:hypothetical protein